MPSENDIKGVPRGPPATFTSEDGGPSPPQDAHEERARDLAGKLFTASSRDVMSEQRVRYLNRTLQRTGDYVNEARENLEEAEKVAVTVAAQVEKEIGSAHRNAARGNVRVTIYTDEDDIDKYAPLRDTIVELGYESCSIEEGQGDGDEVYYHSTPNWIGEELALELDIANGHGDVVAVVHRGSCSDSVVSIYASNVTEEEDEEDGNLTLGFEGLGDLFG